MQLLIFKYESAEEHILNEISTVEIEDEIWFAAPDICSALGLSNVTEALRSLDEDEKLTSISSGQVKCVKLIS